MALDEAFWNAERELLFRVLYPLVLDAAIDSAQNTAEALYADVGLGVDWALVNDAARRWANAYTGDLVRRITDTSRGYVQGAIADWIRSGAPLDDLVDALTPMFGRVRAEMIASTEVTRAYHRGNVEVWRASGFVKGWVFRTAFDELVCPVCGPMHEQRFDLEDQRNAPPLHPRCRCWSAPLVLPEKRKDLTAALGNVVPDSVLGEPQDDVPVVGEP